MTWKQKWKTLISGRIRFNVRFWFEVISKIVALCTIPHVMWVLGFLRWQQLTLGLDEVWDLSHTVGYCLMVNCMTNNQIVRFFCCIAYLFETWGRRLFSIFTAVYIQQFPFQHLWHDQIDWFLCLVPQARCKNAIITLKQSNILLTLKHTYNQR